MALVKQKILSPAKINLMLRVLSQRSDGYHELQTCFQLLNWGDSIAFSQVNEHGCNQIDISGFGGLNAQDNLIYHAAEMIRPWAQKSSDWKILVDKQIPIGAGLGGGSSNAATTLKFLNDQWQCDLSTFDLLALAAKLGADVPVFILGQSAHGTGIGDVLTPMQYSTPYVLLIFPDCHINTSEIFKSSDLNREQSPLGIENLNEESFWINDFFPVVLHKYPEIRRIYQKLKPVINAKLSGSGSTMFALFNDAITAQTACQMVAKVCEAAVVKPLHIL